MESMPEGKISEEKDVTVFSHGGTFINSTFRSELSGYTLCTWVVTRVRTFKR